MVYKAYQSGLDRFVALKVLLQEHCGTPEFQERFLGDAKAVARLSHPNILPVYDVGIEEGISYFAMKYVSGKTLTEKMERHLPYSLIRYYIDQIAAALDHAHKKGIIHRDVKPANILTEDEWTFLTDFGIAKIMADGSALTCTGEILGTPTYISPEQAAGETVGPGTDIYSLGVILYKMIAGRAPFKGETPMGVLYKHIHDPPPTPRQFRPDIPEAVEQVVFKALAKNPSDRFETAGQMASALGQAIAHGLEGNAVAISDPHRQEPRETTRPAPASERLPGNGASPRKIQKGRPDPPSKGQAGKHRNIPAIAILIAAIVAIAILVYSIIIPPYRRGTSFPTGSTPSEPRIPEVPQAPIQERAQTRPEGTKPQARLTVDPKRASLRLVSLPEARAFIDGQYKGSTPCEFMVDLGARHRIRLERYGYEVYDDFIALGSEEPQTLTVSLDRQKPVALLRIDSIRTSPEALRTSRTGGMRRIDMSMTFAVSAQDSKQDSKKGMVVALCWIILKDHVQIGRGESFRTCDKPGTYTETYYFDRNWPPGLLTLRGEVAVGGKKAFKEADFLVQEENPAGR